MMTVFRDSGNVKLGNIFNSGRGRYVLGSERMETSCASGNQMELRKSCHLVIQFG